MENTKEVKDKITEIFIKSESEFAMDTVNGNELLQRILDAIHEFESKYADK